MIKPLSLVKYNYGAFDEDWKQQNPNPYEGIVLVYFGETPQMPGHSYLQNIKTGEPFILDTENLIELTEDEM